MVPTINLKSQNLSHRLRHPRIRRSFGPSLCRALWDQNLTGLVLYVSSFAASAAPTPLKCESLQTSMGNPNKVLQQLVDIRVTGQKVKIRSFRTNLPTQAFKDMTTEDALWMARLISRLSEKQINDALTASGFQSPERELFLDKLAKRRDEIICAFGLEKSNIALWRYARFFSLNRCPFKP